METSRLCALSPHGPQASIHVLGTMTGCWGVGEPSLYLPYTQPMQTHSKMATKRRHIPLAA